MQGATPLFPSSDMPDSPSSIPPRPGSSVSLALMAAGTHRMPLTHWWAWWHDISAIAYTVTDPGVADRKLVWWAQAVNQGFKEAPQHPLLLPLLGTDEARAKAPPLRLWLTQIEGQQQLTQQTRWLDQATLLRHIRNTTSAACEGAAWLCGARDDEALSIAADFGVGLRRAHILFLLGQDARQGWLHIPIDVLQAHDVKAHELLKPPASSPAPNTLALLDAWQGMARTELHQALDRARSLPRPQRSTLRALIVMTRLNLTLLDDLRQARYPIFQQRLILGPWRKLWIAQMARWR